jgi:hypothetical protein
LRAVPGRAQPTAFGAIGGASGVRGLQLSGGGRMRWLRGPPGHLPRTGSRYGYGRSDRRCGLHGVPTGEGWLAARPIGDSGDVDVRIMVRVPDSR